MTTKEAIRTVKIAHTLIWAILASCVIAIPISAYISYFSVASSLIVVVSIETLVLALNGWRWPLTGIAARYTDDRAPNFDIYLPSWLARYNKTIFGTLFVAGMLYTLFKWLGQPGAA